MNTVDKCMRHNTQKSSRGGRIMKGDFKEATNGEKYKIWSHVR